jgi:HD-GYP domain-containing protein (c-di-GMP phosphodiesterase class II)
LANEQPVVALVGERSPRLSGYDVVKRIHDTAGLEALPVILVVRNASRLAQEELRGSGADRLLVWPCHPSTALMTVSSICNLHVQRRWESLSPQPRRALKQTLSAFNGISEAVRLGKGIDAKQIDEATTSLITALNNNHFRVILDAVKDHDDSTYVHCLRVSTFLWLFAHVTGLSRREQTVLATGGLLLDVGKLKVPYDILNKPGGLALNEFTIVKSHVQASVELLQQVPDLRKPIITMAELHHERMDGSGYPYGLAGAQLDELVRMVAIVDVFGALTDRRIYKPAMDPQLALNLMLEGMSRELDPRLLAIFRQAMLDAAVFSDE